MPLAFTYLSQNGSKMPSKALDAATSAGDRESTSMANDHTVKSFDAELRRLVQEIAQRGGLAEEQLAQAIDSLARRDSEAATRVIESDRRIDTMEHEAGNLAVRILALRQPMAT